MFSVLFPGQGSQSVGMARELYDNFDYVKKLFNEAEDALNLPIKKIIFDGPKELLNETENTQPAIFLVSYSIFNVIKNETSFDINKANFFAGHSLGEYTALALAEFVSYRDALKIISVRGDSMQKAVENSNSTMAAVLTSDLKQTIDAVEKLNNQGISINISNFNDASQIVIGGLKDDIDYLKSNPIDLSAKRIIPLDVAGAFHTKFVSPAKQEVQNVVDKVEFSDGKFDVYMNVDAKIAEIKTIKQRLVDQIDNSVMFYDQILNIENIAKPEKWYHIGPGNVTAGMVKKSISSESIEIINSLDSLNNI